LWRRAPNRETSPPRASSEGKKEIRRGGGAKPMGVLGRTALCKEGVSAQSCLTVWREGELHTSDRLSRKMEENLECSAQHCVVKVPGRRSDQAKGRTCGFPTSKFKLSSKKGGKGNSTGPRTKHSRRKKKENSPASTEKSLNNKEKYRDASMNSVFIRKEGGAENLKTATAVRGKTLFLKEPLERLVFY